MTIHTGSDNLMEKINKLIGIVDKMQTDIDTLAINNRTQSNFISNLSKDNKLLNDRLQKSEIELLNLSQYSRRQNIELSGVPENISQRHLENHVLEVLASIGIHLQSYDLVAVHRLGKFIKNKNRNVIIRFINRKNAYTAIQYSWKLSKSKLKYYINENMCHANRQIFNKCYRLKKNGDIFDVWFENGVVSMMINENDQPCSIQHISDIDYFLFEDFNFDISDHISID